MRDIVFSKTSKECLACKYYGDCSTKRLVMCALKEMPPKMVAEAGERATMPLAEDLLVKHDYRNIKVAEGTEITIDLEDIKKQLEKDFYKALGCPFMQNGA